MRLGALFFALLVVACKRDVPPTPPGEPSAAARPPARDPRFDLTPPVPMAPTVSLGETPSAPAALPGIGDTAVANDYQLTLLAVRECKVESYLQPKGESLTLGVELAIEGTREHDVPVSPFHAKLEDADGKTYAATLAGCRPILPSVRVGKGERVEGWVSFELPKSARDPKLSYEPTIIGAAAQPLRFSLGR
jgi:Domain of unknown function (DUF4352)